MSTSGVKTNFNFKATGSAPQAVVRAAVDANLTVSPPVILPPESIYWIITQDLYKPEAITLRDYRQSRGIPTEVITVSQLPGYNAADATPTECQGGFLRECYHYWGDPITDVSQLAVPSLTGFHRETNAFQPYTRVSFIPGLIRAFLREKQKAGTIRAALLIGDPEEVPSFFTQTLDEGNSWTDGEPTMTMPSDFYFMFPLPVMNNFQKTNASSITQGLTPCKDSSGAVVLKPYCADSDTVILASQPDDLRWPTNYPYTRMLGGYLSTNDYKELIPVGRIITQTRLLAAGAKDPSVHDYIEKLKTWESSLPSFQGNSGFSWGGAEGGLISGSDEPTFHSVFGSGSQLFASTYYPTAGVVSGALCTSNIDTDTMFSKLIAKSRRTSLFINGHGSHMHVLGMFPDASGAGPSSGVVFGVNNMKGAGIQSKIWTSGPPGQVDIGTYDNTNSLIGTVVANSCDVSSYNISQYVAHRLGASLGGIQKSFAERWLTSPKGGAIATYMNYFVGWEGEDNTYNQIYMNDGLKAAWNACEPQGMAVIRTAAHALPMGYSWQAFNRVFQGDPMAAIASPAYQCTSHTTSTTTTATKSVGGAL